jgi:hypothetical protein
MIQKIFVLLLCNFHDRSNLKLYDAIVYIMLKLVSIARYMRCSNYMLDKYYILTSLVSNFYIDNFSILNVALGLFLNILRIGTNRDLFCDILYKHAVKLFSYQIEYTLFSYTRVQYFFFARYYYRTVPPLSNARMLCNYIIVKVASGATLKEAFNGVYTWQRH